MTILSEQVKGIVGDYFPDCNSDNKLLLEAAIQDILEGKDIARFKGDISIYKQGALSTDSGKPLYPRKGLEKNAAKEVAQLIKKTESEMISHLYRFRSDDPSRQISKTQFRNRMKSTLQQAYRKAYEIGTKGSSVGTAAPGLVGHSSEDEKRFVASVFAEEAKHFNKLIASIISGSESMTRAKMRIGRYSNAVRSTYEAAKLLQVPDDSILHWVLQSGNPCEDCRTIQRLSPFTKRTLPTTPKAGSTRCLDRCFCKVRVEKATPEEVARVAKKNKSAQLMLKKLRQSRKS